MPVVDAAELPAAPLQADVVVVGSGPAGLTVAMDLAAAGVDVLVLESGGRLPSGGGRDLDAGESVGLPLRFDGVPVTPADMRLRALGGTSGLWSGMCRPLGAAELQHPAPGFAAWPLTETDLAPWYRRAEATLALEPGAWDPATWHGRLGSRPLLPPADRWDEVVFQFSRPVRFGTDFAATLDAPSGPRVVLGATVVALRTGPSGRRLDEVAVRRDDGSVLPVSAGSAYVLATGGLEVPRLLLAGGDGGRGGSVANSSGLVGVGFMDHPHRWAGRAHLAVDDAALGSLRLGPPPGDTGAPAFVWGGWELAPGVLASEGLPNAVVLLWFGDGRGAAAEPPSAVTTAVGTLAAAVEEGAMQPASVTVRTGQRPLAHSRISLGRSRDATGLPRIRLDWQVDPADLAAGRRAVELFGEALGRAGAGRVELDPGGRPFDDLPVEIGNHPMGTARMHIDPAAGVVDPDGRCHDVENLYVAGSATFPASGHANPTLTIVALAHRLADHLTSR
jgi:choline dehydrogenase-like flavoprotein